eukprot:11062786-Alexandrium_andersonii.AAC.1
MVDGACQTDQEFAETVYAALTERYDAGARELPERRDATILEFAGRYSANISELTKRYDAEFRRL